MKRRRRKRTSLHGFLFPHRGNKYHPTIFRFSSVVILSAFIALLLFTYIFATNLSPRSGFFASVLPAALTADTNADRVAASLPELTPDDLLAKAAQMKADDMAAKGYFSHVSPDGKTPWYWLDTVGYQYSYAGENLAVDFSDSKDVEEAWMQSPAHHDNIVKRAYTKIGIGVAQGMYEGHATTFVVELFATPAEAATVAPETHVAERAPKDTKVLAAEAQPKKAAVTPLPQATPVVLAVAAPKHTFMTVIGVMLLIVLGLFSVMIAVHSHLKKTALEAVGGGVVLASVLLGSLIYASQQEMPTLPHDTQSASVFSALTAF